MKYKRLEVLYLEIRSEVENMTKELDPVRQAKIKALMAEQEGSFSRRVKLSFAWASAVTMLAAVTGMGAYAYNLFQYPEAAMNRTENAYRAVAKPEGAEQPVSFPDCSKETSKTIVHGGKRYDITCKP